MARLQGLGRGLDALIPTAAGGGAVEELPLDQIARNPHQPRERFDDEPLAELAASISLHGVLQPVVVRSTPDGRYQLIAGERRLRASRLAGRDTIPAIVRDSIGPDPLQLALVENLQRADLNALEEAAAYRELIDRFGLTAQEVARQVGKSRVAVANALRLLDLAPETRAAIAEGRISEGHGRALGGLTAPEVQRAALGIVLDRQLSVRQTEELVRRKRERPGSVSSSRVSHELTDLEAELRGMLATRVTVTRSRRGGRVAIDFFSDEELDRIHAIISRGAAAEAPAPSSGGFR